MQIIKEWPRLQATARTGKTKYWVVRVARDLQWHYVEVEYWQDSGAHQVQNRKVQGKNIGRSNETTPLQQALLEAESDFKKQQDKGYTENGQREVVYTLPMLAQDYKSKGHKVSFPCFAQPKLDGVRCLYNPSYGFWSRQGKPFTAVNLDHLRWLGIEHITLDGELILPKPYTFQQTVSAVKKQTELTPLLEYHVFDTVIEGHFRNRWLSLDRMAQQFHTTRPHNLRLVQTVSVTDQSTIDRLLQSYLEQGYEGLILRNYEGEYEVGQRSHDLQKYKNFVDAEYPICDVTDGVGKEEGAAIFICRTPAGKVFNVRPSGDYETRRQIFRTRDDYIGQNLVVRYQNLTDENVPRFPVGVGLRAD